VLTVFPAWLIVNRDLPQNAVRAKSVDYRGCALMALALASICLASGNIGKKICQIAELFVDLPVFTGMARRLNLHRDVSVNNSKINHACQFF
jgi:hypothetical protein